ncbi:MAG: hypothetical protein QOJ46_829 [bacterium]
MTTGSRITCGVLGVTGLDAIVVGAHDLLFAGDLQPEISGALLLGAGLVMVSAAATSRRAEYRSLRLVACGFGALIFALLFVTQLLSRNPGWLLAAWLAGACVEAGCAWFVWTSVARSERRLSVRRAGLAALGTLAALLQFWWVSIYTPARAPADVSISMALTQTAGRTHRHSKLTFIEGTITVTNTSGSLARVAGSIYVVRSSRRVPRSGTALTSRHVEPTPPEEQRYATTGHETVVAQGPLIRSGHFLDAGQQATIPITIAVHRSPFAVVLVTASIAVAREPLKFRPNAINIPGGGHALAIADSSWLHRLARGPRYLRVKYDSDGSPAVSAAISRHPDRDDSASYQEAMRHVYGLTNYSSSGATMLAR